MRMVMQHPTGPVLVAVTCPQSSHGGGKGVTPFGRCFPGAAALRHWVSCLAATCSPGKLGISGTSHLPNDCRCIVGSEMPFREGLARLALHSLSAEFTCLLLVLSKTNVVAAVHSL
jgi:hypothetical protein